MRITEDEGRPAVDSPGIRLRNRLARFRFRPWVRLLFGFGTRPLDGFWGWGRGTPIHRWYLDRFIEEHAADIGGHVLEFSEDRYATRHGGARVTKLDIVDLEATNRAATIVADLTKPNAVPSAAFDCILCTHVLHLVGDYPAMLAEFHRMLKPGGVLLVAVPQMSMAAAKDMPWIEFWRFTPVGLGLALEKDFGPGAAAIRGYGNSLTSAAEIRGLAAEDMTERELLVDDNRFAVEVCGRVVRRA
ncbi:Methyltransferase domain-containing protein [Verrucomicrobium sp. GAS474]|uniref:methyltransferase domain-containing protein n=1 Tax=Verrucomicrobium sp. GAS474 TaxID=1882831 RepID=UPI00087DE111|nr:methyltransferase domain-containing protein [Verrucomicrobium sp. GAS474]SDT86160.1 Methyltransferase domain-containing protein [Verrucomicrobium sp. GAS474]